MAEQFDPYYHWFGIRPNDQPPNHYRLLGIELFEDGLVVIDEAFHRRRSYLLDHVAGSHGSEARQILDQLLTARDCLSNPVSKLAYDADLLFGPEQESESSVPAGKRAAPAVPPPISCEAANVPEIDESSGRHAPVPPPLKDEPPISDDAKIAFASSESTSPIAISKPLPQKTFAHKSCERRVSRRLVVIAALCALAGILGAVIVTRQTRDRDASSDNGTVTATTIAEPNASKSHTADQSSTNKSGQEDGGVRQFEDVESPDRESTPETSNVGVDQVVKQRETVVLPADDVSASLDSRPGAEKSGHSLSVRGGLTLWLDASNRESLLLGEQERVEQWNDLSGNENHAAATASERGPVYLESSGRSLSRVRFDGNQSLVIANGAGFNFGDSYSFVFVAQGEEGVMADKGDGYKPGAFSFWNDVATFRTHNKMLKAGDPSPSSLKVRAVVADESNVRWFVGNELSSVHQRDHSIDNEQPFVIGSRSKSADPRFFAGEICELLVFKRALSDDEYGRLEADLSAKWLSGPTIRIVANKPSTVAIKPNTKTAASRKAIENDRAVDASESFRPPSFTGEIFCDIWRDCRGNAVEDVINIIKERPDPDETVRIKSLETPEDFADNYAQRLRGYLHPPETGQYTFKIRANAEGAIYLSTDTDPDNKRRVEPDETVDLAAGEVYYVEALHKESTGRDYFQVGWKLPSGAEEFPISESRISVKPRLIPSHESGFVLLKPVRATASEEAKLELLKDGRVLATGPVREGEFFDVGFETDIPTITALRIEPLQHDRLPANGPGFGPAGRFMLAEVAVSLKPKSSATDEKLVGISRVISEDAGARRLIDGDSKTKWLVRRGSRSASAALVPSEPIELNPESMLVVRLLNGEGIGCFRVLATSSPNPDRIPTSGPDPAEADSKDGLALFVNVGGENFTDQDGKTWTGSRIFDGKTYGHDGGTSVTDDDVDNPLAGSAQRGILAFRAVVPNGAYEVGLYFCEYWTDNSSRRVFSVAVERKTVLRNFDLLRAAGGQGRPFIVPIRKVIVKDGRLDIDFQPAGPRASAILNAISIRRLK